MKVTCGYCGQTFDANDLSLDEHDEPRWCPNCDHDCWIDMNDEALKYAESIGIYEYEVQRQYIEYWSFFKGEGFRFVRRNLISGVEDRGTLIPWTMADPYPVPKFLRTEGGATLYNYNVG